MNLTASARAEARAKNAGLRTYRFDGHAYKVECTTKLCEHRTNDRWHVVTIGYRPEADRCDCVHGIHLYRGTCHHIGAVRRRRDFKRPESTGLRSPLEDCR